MHRVNIDGMQFWREKKANLKKLSWYYLCRVFGLLPLIDAFLLCFRAQHLTPCSRAKSVSIMNEEFYLEYLICMQ